MIFHVEQSSGKVLVEICCFRIMPGSSLTEDEQLKEFFMNKLANDTTTQTAILAMETLNKAIDIDKGYVIIITVSGLIRF